MYLIVKVSCGAFWEDIEMKKKVIRLYRKIIHKLIVKYLISCGGAFHHGKYGESGRYVVLLNEQQYHDHHHID